MSEIVLPRTGTRLDDGRDGRRIIVLSGPVSSGKTTLADALRRKYDMEWFKTREVIRDPDASVQERGALQRAGEARDRRTHGRWVVDALTRYLTRQEALAPGVRHVIVDAVRTPLQVEAIREAFGARVTHVHLTAPDPVLSTRYEARRALSGAVKELTSYDAVRANATERRVGRLAKVADIVIDTARNAAADVLVRVASALGLYGRSVDRLVDVVVGGAYGGEGKGHIASFLAPEYDLLLRGGGPDAGHTVFERPVPYTFHHLPSGTRNSNARIALGPGTVLWVDGLLAEIADCEVDKERLTIDPNALILEPEDWSSGARAHGWPSDPEGRGVAVASARRLLRREAERPVRLARDVGVLRQYLRDTEEVLETAFRDARRVLLEGTQGTALSVYHARTYPDVAPRDTSVSGCLSEVGVAPARVRRTVMVCRPYTVRAPAARSESGVQPVRSVTWDEIATRSGVPVAELLATTGTARGSARERRVAEFDWTLLRRAATLNGPTDVALCFADHIKVKNRQAFRFELLTEETIRFVEEVERVANAPVSLISTRFQARSIIDRRSW